MPKTAKKIPSKILAFLATLTAMIGLLITIAPGKAQAESCSYDKYWPSRGAVKTVGPIDGDVYGVTLEFQISSSEVDSLRCFAEFVEIDFHTEGFNLSKQWSSYAIYSNIPGATRDIAASDNSTTEQIPAATNIRVNHLLHDYTYYATIWWHAPQASSAPRVWINWVPSYWASWSRNPAEWGLCQAALNNPGYCIFGHRLNGLSLAALMTQTWFKGTEYSKIPFRSTPLTISTSSFSTSTSAPSSAPPANWSQNIPTTAIAPAPDPVKPTAISRNDRTMDVFYKSENGNLVARGWDVDFGWNYQWWPNKLAGNPVAVARK
ncbi:MAG: hypothetical protein PVI21_05885, partial [Candidatus Woesebacteria bacterium]